VELQADGVGTITADQGELEMILNNLVSNAIKYNRDNGRVEVRLTRADDRVTIRVADTGIGIAPENAAKLFGEFVRIKNSQTRNILGSGLGLSIVRQLAMLYGGEAAVESTPDVGSTFSVVLKDRVPAAAAARAGSEN
jgi:signal transduction histidine kinase